MICFDLFKLFVFNSNKLKFASNMNEISKIPTRRCLVLTHMNERTNGRTDERSFSSFISSRARLGPRFHIWHFTSVQFSSVQYVKQIKNFRNVVLFLTLVKLQCFARGWNCFYSLKRWQLILCHKIFWE